MIKLRALSDRGGISLAHHGGLFFDESPEFERGVLETLRGPLETGRVAISRAARLAEYPARFQLIAAMNSRPCGRLGHYNGRCRCTPDQVARYRGKISGPFMDRIDKHLEVPAVPQVDLLRQSAGEPSGAVRERVATTHRLQIERQGKANSSLDTREIDKWCAPDAAAEGLLGQAKGRAGGACRGSIQVDSKAFQESGDCCLSSKPFELARISLPSTGSE